MKTLVALPLPAMRARAPPSATFTSPSVPAAAGSGCERARSDIGGPIAAPPVPEPAWLQMATGLAALRHITPRRNA